MPRRKELPDIIHRAVEHKCPHCGKKAIYDIDLRPIKAGAKGNPYMNEGMRKNATE